MFSIKLISGRGQNGCQEVNICVKCEPEQWKGTGRLSGEVGDTTWLQQGHLLLADTEILKKILKL